LIVALVLVCAGIGSVLFFAFNGGLPTILSDAPLLSSQAEESETLEVEGPVTLKVVDESGKVTVTGADVDEVTVNVVKTGLGTTQAKADEALENIRYEIDQDGDTITLTFEYPEVRTQIYERVDFIVTVPVETEVDVTAKAGAVSVMGVQGQVGIENNFGDIAVEDVEGPLVVKTDSGRIDLNSVQAGSDDIDLYSGFGSIYLSQVSGAGISIESRSGKLDLENVRATQGMELFSDFGNIDYETGSAGSLEVRTKSGAIRLASVTVRGLLTLRDDFGDISLEQVRASSYDAETSSGSITVDGVEGELRAHTGFGNITVTKAENVKVELNTKSGSIDFEGTLGEGPHSIHSDFGEIEVSIPADSALDVDFRTDFGKVHSAIPLTLSGEIDQAHQVGTINGGGDALSVSTKSGGITIKALGG
jgi:DUF4097 and DUF4098 domain-containing protein YvlB